MNAILIACVGTVIANILLLWIIIKLYTEILKIMNFNIKAEKGTAIK